MFAANLKEGQLGELLHILESWYIDRVDFSIEVKQLDVYVEPKHYFTLHFDALIITLAKDMPMDAVGSKESVQ